jgi:hypothetical protein
MKIINRLLNKNKIRKLNLGQLGFALIHKTTTTTKILINLTIAKLNVDS